MTTTWRYAKKDITSLSPGYEARLVDLPVITRKLNDPLRGFVEIQEVNWSLANGDQALTAAILSDLRDKPVELDWYDEYTNFQQAAFVGKMVDATLAHPNARFTAADVSLEIFEQLVPKVLVESDWISGAPASAKVPDLGATIPVVFGNVPAVRLPYVYEDLVNQVYVYVVAHGTVTVTAAYRNGPNDTLYTIQPSECKKADGTAASTWAEASLSMSVGGNAYTVIKPILRQQDFQNGLHVIHAGVTGFSAERNAVRALRTILSNTTWGLGKSVNAASFDAAEALMVPATTGLYCDGAMTSQETADVLVRELVMFRGLRLASNASAEWTVSVDTQESKIRLTASDGAGPGRRTLLAPVVRRPFSTTRDAVKAVKLSYRRDGVTGEWRHVASRAVESSRGADLPMSNRFIRDHGTADRVGYYVGRRLYWWSRDICDVQMTQEARQLREGGLVEVIDSRAGMSSATVLEAHEVTLTLHRVTALCHGWDTDIYVYSPSSSIPTTSDTAAPEIEDDPYRTDPDPVTSLSISNSGVEISPTDGLAHAWVVLQFTTPSENYDHASVRYRVNGSGSTGWQKGDSDVEGTGTVTTRIGGLQVGVAYDYQVKSVNVAGRKSSATTLSNQTAPTNGPTPSAPTSVSCTAGLKHLRVRVSGTKPTDYEETVLYRNTVNNSGTATEIDRGRKNVFDVTDISYDTNYYFWAKYGTYTKQLSAFSTVGSGSVPKVGNGDMGADSIGTLQLITAGVTGSKIDDGAVDASKRQELQALVETQTVMPVGEIAGAPTYFTFNHNLGYIPSWYYQLPLGDPFAYLIIIHPMLVSDSQVILAAYNYDTVSHGVDITFWYW